MFNILFIITCFADAQGEYFDIVVNNSRFGGPAVGCTDNSDAPCMMTAAQACLACGGGTPAFAGCNDGCGLHTCGALCVGPCGWSRNQNRCVLGGNTVAAELELGPGCAASQTTTVSSATSALDCTSITCSNDCIDSCGWSSSKNLCILGGTTTSSEVNLGPGCGDVAPTTAAPTTAFDCGSILCSNFCTFPCGWSTNKDLCVFGGTTTASEVDLGPGCGIASSATEASVESNTTTSLPTTTLVSLTGEECLAITCSNDCSGVCGWSSNRNECILGGRTTSSEVNLGVC